MNLFDLFRRKKESHAAPPQAPIGDTAATDATQPSAKAEGTKRTRNRNPKNVPFRVLAKNG